uniref:Uncharacterized protein n=1 Tax=Arundo donax TaxID=35708 RepID=A0A0A9FBW9_ARUDO
MEQTLLWLVRSLFETLPYVLRVLHNFASS